MALIQWWSGFLIFSIAVFFLLKTTKGGRVGLAENSQIEKDGIFLELAVAKVWDM